MDKMRDPLDEWHAKAREDIAVTRHMQTYNPTPVSVICYHCQQAGEKILKGLLAQAGKEIPRTHSLSLILAAIGDPRLKPLQHACDLLTDYPAITRYPSLYEISRDDMEAALSALDRIIAKVEEIGYPIE